MKILAAGKYAEVKSHGPASGCAVAGGREHTGANAPGHRAGGVRRVETARHQGPALDPYRKGKALATKGAKAPAILVPNRAKMLHWGEFMWREMREGGLLKRYLERERAQSVRRQRLTARRFHGFKQNGKSDMVLEAVIPAREYIRWKAEDPHFFEDKANLKSLRRDNPDLPIFV